MQKTIGLVGGLGPEATIDYYRRFQAVWAERFPGSAPRLVIDSLDAPFVLRLAVSDRPALAAYILESVRRLQAAGSDIGAITSNTTHLVYDEVARDSSLPLVSIVEACADEVARLKFRKPLLLGARFVMAGEFYPATFARRALAVVAPEPADQTWVHDRYVNQLLKGEFRDDTRAEFESLVHRMRSSHAIDAVILGGTELPLLLRDPTIAGLPALDTTRLHIAEIMRRIAP